MVLNNLESDLLARYKQLYEERGCPSWAHGFRPPIPFVGRNVLKTIPRVLIYASAENLTYVFEKHDCVYPLEKLDAEQQHFRHRALYAGPGEKRNFPFIHMQPVNNGSLLVVARYLLERMGHDLSFSRDPFEFVEEVTAGNLGKYSIAAITNRDYASDREKIKESLGYISADIATIKPDIVILPKTIFDVVRACCGWQGIVDGVPLGTVITFVKIYQVNARVINTHIKKEVGDRPVRDLHSTSVGAWLEKCTVRNIEKYLAWIDKKWDKSGLEFLERIESKRL